MPAYVAYDTDTLEMINAPAAAQDVAAPALSDPDTIAIIDTAFNLEHSEYSDRVLDYFDGLSEFDEPYDVPYDEPVAGFRNHGTAVASLAGGDNVGISPNSGLMLVRAAMAVDENTAKSLPNSAVAAGIEHLLGRGADVLNLSMTLSAYDGNPLDPASRVNAALKTGIAEDDWVVVISAGNDGKGVVGFASQVDWPEYQGQALTVGALGGQKPDAYMASFSNNATHRYNPSEAVTHFIVAPGLLLCAAQDIDRIYGDHAPGCNYPTLGQIEAGMVSTDVNDALSSFTGTSAAAPVISGAVARIRRAYPELDGAAVVQLLMDTATDLGEPGYDPIFGVGLVNLEAALEAGATFVYEPAKAEKPVVAMARTARAAAERRVPDNAIEIGDDLYMVPTAPAPNGCMMFTSWSATRNIDTAIYWRSVRGEFSMSPANCVVVKHGARA
ncbi:subtilase [Salinisphaera sp. T5B8]